MTRLTIVIFPSILNQGSSGDQSELIDSLMKEKIGPDDSYGQIIPRADPNNPYTIYEIYIPYSGFSWIPVRWPYIQISCFDQMHADDALAKFISNVMSRNITYIFSPHAPAPLTKLTEFLKVSGIKHEVQRL